MDKFQHLWKRLAKSSLISFQQFYNAIHPALFHFALYILKSESDAKETTNDVLLKIWQRRSELGPFDQEAPQRLKAYAMRAIKNTALNKLRQDKKLWVQLDEDIPESQTADQNLLHEDIQSQMKYLLNQLPDRCRQVFSMSRFDQLSNKEIAELLDISVKTVENQMTKALHFFRKNLRHE